MRRSILLFVLFVMMLCIASLSENEERNDVNTKWVNTTTNLTAKEQPQNRLHLLDSTNTK
nr:hypothetical protein [uncultured Allomuricauda sp.]